MAECLINELGKNRYAAVSAGSFPAGYVHTESVSALKRHGIDPGEPRSKSWDEFTGEAFDLIITVCDQAANEACPAFLGNYQKLHWSTPDPAKVVGSDEEIRQAFDDALQLLKSRIEGELL